MTGKWSIYRNSITKYWVVHNSQDVVYVFSNGVLAHKAFHNGTTGR